MGQDLSIVLSPAEVPASTLLTAAREAFSTDPPENLVLLISNQGPASLRSVLPKFTAVSLWTEAESGLSKFASILSRQVNKCLAFTIADHSCTGGWQVFESGRKGASRWLEGDEYPMAGIAGIEAAFGKIHSGRASCSGDDFLTKLRGLCVFGSTGGLQAGQPVSSDKIQSILEDDLPGAPMECLLLAGDDP